MTYFVLNYKSLWPQNGVCVIKQYLTKQRHIDVIQTNIQEYKGL